MNITEKLLSIPYLAMTKTGILRQKPGFIFHFPAKNECNRGEVVILIHGLFHNGYHMYPMGKFLSSNGYDVWGYDYRTSYGNVEKHAKDLIDCLSLLPKRNWNVVTHSLGSLVIREALSQATFPQIRRIVMLAPPNRGSKVASLALKTIPFVHKISRPLPDLRYGGSANVQQHLMPTEIQVGIIAASADILVPLDSTSLPEQADFTMVCSDHSHIMMRRAAQQQTLEFLIHGKFQ